jgi:hypothetical protein
LEFSDRDDMIEFLHQNYQPLTFQPKL